MTQPPKPATSGQDILNRIDRRIAALKTAGKTVSDRSISLKATKSPDTIRSIRRGISEGSQTGVSTETLRKLALPLETTAEWLLRGEGVEDIDDLPPEDPHTESSHELNEAPAAYRFGGAGVRIVGYVGAGSEAHYYALAQDDFEEVDRPAGATDQTVAVEIRGKSFGPLMDSMLVFYDDVRSPVTADLIGRICVVCLADDRVLLKKIIRENGSFTLLSNSNEPPIKDAEIVWAAAITDIRPRR